MTLVYFAIAFTVGILAGHVLRSEGLLGCSLPAWCFPLLTAVLCAVAFVLRRRPKLALGLAIALLFVLGAWRYTGNPFERCWTPNDLPYYQTEAGVWATIEGEVIGFPDVQDNGTRYQLAVRRLVVDGQARAVSGKTLVEAARYPIYAYGEKLRVSGLLLEPPTSDDFDYRRFLATRGIHTLVRRPNVEHLAFGGGAAFWRVLYAARSRGANIINRIMPEPAAALTNGMALGIEGGISDEVDAAFRATGTTHLIVISGSNIALLAAALAAMLSQVMAKRRAALVAAPLVLLYVLLVGADPPALRAGVMGLLALGAVFFGRRGTAYVSLCAAGLVMLALNPLTLWDIGFQLSFVTSLGLILLSRPLSRAAVATLRRRLPADTARRGAALLESTLIVTVAAQIAVLPLILHYFGRLSPVSLLANGLVLPVQPPILVGGIAALLAGAAWQPFGQAVATVPWLLLSYTVGVVRATAAMPFASLAVGRVEPGFIAAYYLVLAFALGFPRIMRVLRRQPDLRRAAAWGAAFAVPACLVFFAWRAQPDGRLHVIFVPATDTEAAVIVAPSGRTAWLWDGHGDGEALVAATRGGGWVRGRPDVVLVDCDANPWQGGACIDPARLAPGAALSLDEGLRVTRLAADGPPVLLLSFGELTLPLPSTLPPGAQVSVSGLPSVSLLKATGPGTGAWPAVQYLRAAQPQLVLWPLDTTYPPDVTEYLQGQVSTARVDAEGAVEVISDGARFWLTRYSSIGAR